MTRIPPTPTGEYQKIAVLENIVESQVLASILNDEGIPHRIRSFHDTAYDGLFQFQLGWGAVYAPSPYKRPIREILQKIRTKNQSNSV